MRILICTQKVDKDDAVLGFFHRYLQEFSKHFEQVTVIALGVGAYDLPSNVRVISLGKESGTGALGYTLTFLPLIFTLRNEYDAVFVHMSVEFAILGGAFWRMAGKRMVLWYTHRQDNWRVRMGAFFANQILTASIKSFPFASVKLRVIGHGIDTGAFACPPDQAKPDPADILRILTVGRITRIKNCDTLIRAVAKLRDDGVPVRATFLGAPGTDDDRVYEQELKALIASLDIAGALLFPGSIPNREIAKWYCKADIVTNMTPTGGIDKAVLEAMAAGRIPLVSNTAFEEHFGAYASKLIFKERDADDLAAKLRALSTHPDRARIAETLHDYTQKNFDVVPMVGKIASALQEK